MNGRAKRVVAAFRLAGKPGRRKPASDTVENIATDCGFAKVSRLNAEFKRKYGSSMSDYLR